MKLWIALLLGLVLAVPASAYVNTPPGVGTAIARDTSLTNIPTAYASAGAQLLSGLSEKKHVAVYNGTSTLIMLSTTTTTTNCSGGSDNTFVPPSGTATIEDLKINTVICARSSGVSAISTGTIAIAAW